MEPFQPLQLLRRYRAHLAITVLSVLLPVLIFLWKVLAARALPPFQFGVLMFVFSAANLLSTVTAGYRVFYFRECAKNREDSAGRILGVILLSSFLATAALALLALIAESSRVLLITYALFLPILTLALTLPIHWQAKRAFRVLIKYSTLRIILLFLLPLIVYFTTPTPFAFLLAYILPFLVVILAKDFAKLVRSIEFKEFVKTALAGVPFLFLVAGNTVFTNVDTIMLTALRNYALAGAYRAAASISRIVLMLAAAALATYIPTLANIRDRHRFLSSNRKYILLLSVLVVPTGFLLVLKPGLVILLTLGEKYVGVSTVLAVLSLFTIFHALFQISHRMLLVLDGERKLALATGIGATLNVVLNVILIPPLGMLGAALATGISYLTVDLLNTYWALKLFRQHFKGEA